MKLIICRGLPASGKSTWAKEYVKKNHVTVRVNRDDIRAMMHCDKKWNGKQESITVKVQHQIINQSLANNLDVIVDDTNLNPKVVEQLRVIAKNHSAEVVVKDFTDVSVDVCIERDLKRANSVGESVIRKMYYSYLHVKPEPQDETLPHAIICDMDGTLSDLNGRSPFDDWLCGNDIPHQNVMNMIGIYTTYMPAHLIIMSGRDEGRAREATEKWLSEYGISYTHLFMRPAGDQRKDSIVKRELYEAHVKNKYFVNFWVDDRDQVVRMVRDELGIPVHQVAYGDF